MSKYALLLLANVFTFFCHAQKIPIPNEKVKEIVISQKVTVKLLGGRSEHNFYLFFRDGLVLEPFKIDPSKASAGSNQQSSESNTLKMKPDYIFFTELSKRKGMDFKLGGKSEPDRIKAYLGKVTNQGFSRLSEPYLPDGITLKDFSIVKDTTINNRHYISIRVTKLQPSISLDQDDKVVSTFMIIDKGIKGCEFPFISEQISRHYGGAIILVEQKYKSGLAIMQNFDYRPKFNEEELNMFNKYLDLYTINSALPNKKESYEK